MSRGQRSTFLAVALAIAVVAIVVLAGGSDDPSGDGSAATATPTATPAATTESQEPQPTETPTATPTPAPPPLLTGAKVTKLEAEQGDTVRFRVRSAEAEEVHVHGYDISKDLEPGKTETMSFEATITGIFEIEFEHSGEQIAELRVDPS